MTRAAWTTVIDCEPEAERRRPSSRRACSDLGHVGTERQRTSSRIEIQSCICTLYGSRYMTRDIGLRSKVTRRQYCKETRDAPMAMADAIRVSPPRRRPSLRSEITRQRSALSGSERSRANYATGSGTHANRALCLSSDIACLRCVPVRHVHARRGCQ